ncbi:MAG: metallophosphoesterase [Candidatus Altiarchaeota archaeon]
MQKQINADEFLRLIENVKDILIKEKLERGYVAKISEDEKELIIVGDIHGDIKSLKFILDDTKKIAKKKFLFLGDYADRGLFQVEVYHSILKLKENFPDTILLRGNHEFPNGLEVYPHDLPIHLKEKFPDKWQNIYKKIREFWELLPLCAILDKKYLFLHGGLPSELKSLQDLSSKKFIEEILWNDPTDEISDIANNPRGAGKIFGKDITEKILNSLGLKTLVRSHESCNGFKINHDGLILTIFSTKGPYGNENASYLKINPREKAKDAYKLSDENLRIF